MHIVSYFFAAILSYVVASYIVYYGLRQISSQRAERKIIIPMIATFSVFYIPMYAWLSPSLLGFSSLNDIWRFFLITIEGYFYANFTMMLVRELEGWRWNYRRLGLPTRKVSTVYGELTKESRSYLPLTSDVASVLLLGSILGYFFSFRFFIASLFLVITRKLTDFLHTHRPCAILVLSSSSPDAIMLHARLSRLEMNARIVSLLDTNNLKDDWVEVQINTDCLRTRGDESWQSVVVKLLDLVPILVVDARNIITSQLEWELREIETADLFYKTVLILKSTDMENEQLHKFNYESNSGIVNFQDEEDVFLLIRYCLSDKQNLPSRERPMRLLARELTDVVKASLYSSNERQPGKEVGKGFIAFMKEEQVRIAARRLKESPHLWLQRRAVDSLARFASENPHAIGALRQTALQHPSSEIRQLALNRLSDLDKTSRSQIVHNQSQTAIQNVETQGSKNRTDL